jgi:hypothetical protein
MLYLKLFSAKLEKFRANRKELMIESGSLNDNSPSLSITDSQKKIKTLVSLVCKERLDKENISIAVVKFGCLTNHYYRTLLN